jgi:hypothetical protein
MKKSSDQTFMLTLSTHNETQASILQSALTPVRSVECGLFA